MIRSTVIVDGPLALRMQRLTAAREGAVGRDLLTLPLLAARLAGGFTTIAGTDVLYPAIQSALAEGGFRELGQVALLPGMPRAVLQSLDAIWRADIDLSSLSNKIERFADLFLIEARVRAALPSAHLLPRDLRSAAMRRLTLAQTLLGPVTLAGMLRVDPIWHPLVAGIAEFTEVSWENPTHSAHPWFKGAIRRRVPAGPAAISAEASADPRSEVVEALRWARHLLASGKVKAEEIAIAATSPKGWDDHFLVLSASADLPLHFSHGIPALSTLDGQACAALADILTSGLSQERVWRLIRRLPPAPFGTRLPGDWSAGLPREATLKTLEHWRYALATARPRREGGDLTEQILLPILELLARGPSAGQEAARLLLSGSSLLMWEEALGSAPAHAIALSLGELRVADGRDPGNSIVWGPAGHLATAPRSWTRLLGMTSRSWPRSEDDDALLPDHLLPRNILHPVAIAERDRLDFEVISAGTRETLVLSRSQRSAAGGILSPSSLWPGDHIVHKRDRIPTHAFSESDRLLARPIDAGKDGRVRQSKRCWHNWERDSALTAHDGLATSNHPAVEAALARIQSTTSLQRLLRDPLGFVWRYALGWRSTRLHAEPLQLDPGTFGELTHELISCAISRLEPTPGFARASEGEISAAIEVASAKIASSWPLIRSVPPPILWRHTVREASRRTASGLAADEPTQAGTRSWTEVPFGQREASLVELPWNTSIMIPIEQVGLTFGGRIDRLDIRAAGDAVRITDYKSGQSPDKARRITLAQGRELQRVLYAMAVRTLLPEVKVVLARLVFLNDDPAIFVLRDEELDQAIADATMYLGAAIDILRSGRIAPRWEQDATYDDMRLALPADREVYLRRKATSFRDANQKLDKLWRTAS